MTGTFVIRWSQTCVDGQDGASEPHLEAGATWRWTGRAIRLDGPDGIARLSAAEGMQDLHRRAAQKARRICGRTAAQAWSSVEIDEDRLLDNSFVLTDGVQAFAASRIGTGTAALVVFLGDLPPVDADLWIVRVSTNARAEALARQAQVAVAAGLVAGTPVATPSGPRAAETLQPGDLVETRDAGTQPILWCGTRRLTGAGLHMAPRFRPIRIAAGALGPERPRSELMVAPGHRVVVSGPVAQTLFAEPELLVRAQDLVALPGVSTDLAVTKVSYVHLMLERHHVLIAGGLPVESFHPDEADIPALMQGDILQLRGRCPDVVDDPSLYGPPARRRLAAGEAAILVSGLA